MKKRMIWGAMMALVSVFVLSFISCSNDNEDENVSNVQITKTELGKENSKTAVSGKDLHIECEILAKAKIKSIKVSLLQADGKTVLSKDFSSNKNYVGVINAHFHEHIELESTLAAGTYKFVFTVTDGNGKEASWTEMLTIKAPDTNAPKIEFTVPNASKMTAAAGSKFTIEADVTVMSAVKSIELEFHGAKEYPIEVSDYNGRTGAFKFSKEITIPAEAAAGEYHLHFTVIDVNGRANTEEFEGFKITAKK